VTDAEFLSAFDDTTLEPFHHRDHLRVTYLYLAQFGREETERRLGPAILRYAEARGGGAKYHQTITLAWIGLVARASENTRDFEEMIVNHAELLDKNLLQRHYSEARIGSDEARHGWIEPDLLPLPRD
jgi:hypothetical protein